MVDTELIDFKSSPETEVSTATSSSSPPPARVHDAGTGDIQISFNFTIPGSRVVRGQLRTVRRILLATIVITLLTLISSFLRLLAFVLRAVIAPVIRHGLVRALVFLAIVFWPSDTVNRLAAAPEIAPVLEFLRGRGWGRGRRQSGVRIE